MIMCREATWRLVAHPQSSLSFQMFCLTGRAALAQLFLSAFSAALTQQLVVAHQQFHRGELVEAGLDGALLGAGCVTVRQRLEGPLVVLMVEVIS